MMRNSKVRTGSTHAVARGRVLGAILAISPVGCYTGAEPAAVEFVTSAPTPALADIDRAVVAAASEFGIPVEVLRQALRGQAPGGDASRGPLGLTATQRELGAEIAGIPTDAVTDLDADLRIGAAVLANIADDLELDRDDEAAWTPARIAFHEGATSSDALGFSAAHARAAAPLGTLWMTTPQPGACEPDGLAYLGSGALTPARHLDLADDGGDLEDGVAYELVTGFSEFHRYSTCTFGQRHDVYTRAGTRYNCRRVERRAGVVIAETYLGDWQELRDDALLRCGALDGASAGPA